MQLGRDDATNTREHPGKEAIESKDFQKTGTLDAWWSYVEIKEFAICADSQEPTPSTT